MMKSQTDMLVRVHRFLPCTEAEGPGTRAALWVQGCSRKCPGCFNRAAWSHTGGTARTVKAIMNDIMAVRSRIEGVTFVGGEPFEQARPLAELGAACRENGLSVVTFSGYTYAELVSGRRDEWNALLGVTDLLLDGPYVNAGKDTSRPWVGSRNQGFIFLSERYSHLKERLKGIPNRLEFIVGADGSVSLNGLAATDEIREAQTALATFGLTMRKVRS